MQTLTYILLNLKQENAKTNTDALFSVKQYRSIKIAVELIVSIGIIPYLLPNVGIDMTKLCPKALNISQEEKLSCLKVIFLNKIFIQFLQLKSSSSVVFQKFERLCFSTRSLLDLFEDLNSRPAVLFQVGFLMAALLQLAHAPLAKPTSEIQQSSSTNKQEFHMTVEEYRKLQNRQKEFHISFIKLLYNCPKYICFRELMIILGMQNAPKWLRRATQNYLIKMLVESNGVLSLVTAIFEDSLDLGSDWKKLDTISKLIAVSHEKNSDEYYKAVCPQVMTKGIKCIKYIYIKYGNVSY